MKNLKIGLDIDDCLADFMGAYEVYFDTANNPEHLIDANITHNVNNVLIKDKDFWLNLPVMVKLDFEPELYCTKRIIPKSWTREWLRRNGFPIKPIYQIWGQEGNKADLIKGRVDVFIDDSVRNVKDMLKSGMRVLLFKSRERNPELIGIDCITKETIVTALQHF